MVLGGDLNFTLSLREVWGSRPRQDPQEVFFTNSIEKHKLTWFKISQTWRIRRKGKDAVAKRLDHFLLSKNIMEKNWKIKSKVVVGGISDHMPIMLEVCIPSRILPAPMKFNHAWLNANDYKELVKGFWSPLSDSFEGSFMSQFARNIYTVSQATKEWAKEYNKKLKRIYAKLKIDWGKLL
jgi:hypothetical protein